MQIDANHPGSDPSHVRRQSPHEEMTSSSAQNRRPDSIPARRPTARILHSLRTNTRRQSPLEKLPHLIGVVRSSPRPRFGVDLQINNKAKHQISRATIGRGQGLEQRKAQQEWVAHSTMRVQGCPVSAIKGSETWSSVPHLMLSFASPSVCPLRSLAKIIERSESRVAKSVKRQDIRIATI